MTDKEKDEEKQENHDVPIHGERRKGERRKGERRGVLRWDPRRKDRRSGTDRRKPPPSD